MVSEKGYYDYPVTFYLPDYQGDNWSILTPWFDYNVVTRNFLIKNSIDIQTLIEQALFNKQYIYLYVNEKFIPGASPEAEGRDYIIIGFIYNGRTEEVSFLGYDNKRNFNERTIRFEM